MVSSGNVNWTESHRLCGMWLEGRAAREVANSLGKEKWRGGASGQVGLIRLGD